jgi:hypothetical protein
MGVHNPVGAANEDLLLRLGLVCRRSTWSLAFQARDAPSGRKKAKLLPCRHQAMNSGNRLREVQTVKTDAALVLQSPPVSLVLMMDGLGIGGDFDPV